MSIIDFIGSNDGTSSGITSSNIVDGINGKSKALSFNGTDEKVDFGDLGTIRTVTFAINPSTTTEEILLLDTGKDIMVSGGTITYTGVTATDTIVDGVSSTSLVANKWQVVTCVLSADVDANNFEVATDGTNFGAIIMDTLLTSSESMELIQVSDLQNRILRGNI